MIFEWSLSLASQTLPLVLSGREKPIGLGSVAIDLILVDCFCKISLARSQCGACRGLALEQRELAGDALSQ